MSLVKAGLLVDPKRSYIDPEDIKTRDGMEKNRPTEDPDIEGLLQCSDSGPEGYV